MTMMSDEGANKNVPAEQDQRDAVLKGEGPEQDVVVPVGMCVCVVLG